MVRISFINSAAGGYQCYKDAHKVIEMVVLSV